MFPSLGSRYEKVPPASSCSTDSSLPGPDQQPPATIQHLAKWGIHWRTRGTMLFLFTLGLGGGIAHHSFYSWKDDTEAGNETHQLWTIRGGSYLAYVFALSLAAMVGIARDQWLWYTLRNESFTLRTINSMFSVTSNPLSFLNLRMFGGAKVATATIMAIIKWLLPLSAVLTPGTISVILKPVTTNIECTVPSLKFDYDNTTHTTLLNPSEGLNYLVELGSENISPSPQARRIFMMSAFSGRATAGDIKGHNYNRETLVPDCVANCTYSVKFEGPSVSCTEIKFSDLPPWSNSYTFPGCDSNDTLGNMSVPVFRAQRSDKTYNELWLLHSLRKNKTDALACRQPYAYTCKATVSTYTVNLTINNDEFLEPKITNVTFLYNITQEPPSLKMTTEPSSTLQLLRRDSAADAAYSAAYSYNTISDMSGVSYTTVFVNDTSNYPNWALFDTLLEILEGEWTVGSPGVNSSTNITGVPPGWHYRTDVNRTVVGSTSLIGNMSEPVLELGKAIEEMVHRMVVSLLFDRSLCYSATTKSICYSTKQQNTYKYVSSGLVPIYAVAVSVSILMGVLGIVAMISNGVASDASFSTIMLTTRNKDLDEMAKGGCFGASPLPEAFKGVKLKFGDVLGRTDDNATGHAAIGVEAGLTDIKRGGKYY